MNYREKIRKAIECPQFNNTRYGEWGALNLEQRKYIKRLLDELDNADNFVKKLYFENKQLKDNWNDLKKYAKEVISTDNELYGTDLLDKMQELEQGSDSNESKWINWDERKLNECLSQQKEFIKYLENEKDRLESYITLR